MKQGYMVLLYLLLLVLSIGSWIYWSDKQNGWEHTVSFSFIFLFGVLFISEYFTWLYKGKL